MSVNYASVLSINAPENSRTAATIFPASGGVFSGGTQQTISFNIPSTSYFDASGASYLKATVQISATTGSTATTAASALCLDGGATSLFQRVQLFTGDSGVLITEIQNFAEVAQHTLKSHGETYANSIGVQAMAWFPAFNTDDGKNTATVAGSGNTIYQACLNTPLSATSGAASSAFGIPGAVLVPTANSSTTTLGEFFTVAIPLSFLSGLFAVSNLLPAKYMGKSNSLRLDLILAAPNRAIVATSAAPAGATYWDTPNTGLAVNYTVTNCELVTSVLNVGSELDDAVRDMVFTDNGVSIMYKQFTSKLDSNWGASQQQFQTITTKYALSLDKVIFQFRDASKVNNYGYASITGYRRFGLSQIQVAIGPRVYPNKPLTLGQYNYNGDSYINQVQTSTKGSSLLSTNGYYDNGYGNDALAGYEVGFNFAARNLTESSSDTQTQFSGLDTRSGSSSIQLVVYRLTTDLANSTGDFATPLSVMTIMETSAPLIVNSSGVIPTKD